ncbi:MAG: Gfo/Idh/MocA family oxidoreductase [Rhodothermales bacterium]|nr:Gfo/Idh/MocA family oxidoreductase [Rhodothermales bacterium]MBO6779546.1 Gfo/Idh/MocA family oxidoreductase [Rhodothermales bacterium]
MIRWGILSTARINRRFIAAVRAAERSKVVSVASRTPERAANYAHEWGIPSSHGCYQDLVDDPEVDALYIPLPNQLHAPWCVRALKAGKHVLCEKPLALSPVQVDVMARAAEQSGNVLAEAFMYRHHPRTHRVRDLVREGAIGRLRVVHGAFTFLFDRDDNFRLDPAAGGGALWDVGCYPVSFTRYVVGEEPETVQGVSVLGESGVDMLFAGSMRFPSGVLATFDCGFDAVFRSEMTFVGTEGRITVPMAFRPGLTADIVLEQGDESRTVVVPGFEPIFLGEVTDMERAVLDGAAQAIPISESRGNVDAIHRLHESARSMDR